MASYRKYYTSVWLLLLKQYLEANAGRDLIARHSMAYLLNGFLLMRIKS